MVGPKVIAVRVIEMKGDQYQDVDQNLVSTQQVINLAYLVACVLLGPAREKDDWKDQTSSMLCTR